MVLCTRIRDDFQIAIICGLEIEATAVHDMLNIVWSDQKCWFDRAEGVHNEHTVREHNVALAHMPGVDSNNASAVTISIQHRFSNVERVMIVGTCGGAASTSHYQKEIYLEDVTTSMTVIQYDFGRLAPNDSLPRNTLEDTIGLPSSKIRRLLAKLKTWHFGQKMQGETKENLRQSSACKHRFSCPGTRKEVLFKSVYLDEHQVPEHGVLCKECVEATDQTYMAALRTSCKVLQCDHVRIVHWTQWTDSALTSTKSSHSPNTHLRRIGSGNTVMRSGQHYDQIAGQGGVTAFEMEGLGVWHRLASVVMKRVWDFTDCHKSKE